ncbi:MAG: hypothetical protein RBT41_05765 [Clostridia bacterium]|jgi:hypothetical protein|nr:hypothetical protein [Clostridia bacterium]
MERMFAYILFILVAIGTAYLVLGFVLVPVIKMLVDSRRLKRKH